MLLIICSKVVYIFIWFYGCFLDFVLSSNKLFIYGLLLFCYGLEDVKYRLCAVKCLCAYKIVIINLFVERGM